MASLSAVRAIDELLARVGLDPATRRRYRLIKAMLPAARIIR
jgi:hypothetical protein